MLLSHSGTQLRGYLHRTSLVSGLDPAYDYKGESGNGDVGASGEYRFGAPLPD